MSGYPNKLNLEAEMLRGDELIFDREDEITVIFQ